jgi:hypothetical protein
VQEDEAKFDEVEVVSDEEGEYEEFGAEADELSDVEVEVESDVEVEVEVESEDEGEACEADAVTSLVCAYRAWNDDQDLECAIHDRLDDLYANRIDLSDTMCVWNPPESATGSHTKSSHQRAATTTKRCRGTKSRGGDYE